MTFERNEAVQHERLGQGTVIADEGETVIVRFDSGIHECRKTDVTRVGARQDPTTTDPASEVLVRSLALAIESINDSWGVFSRSRIDLLPHQLWVCHLALRSWPMRWLIADDVGLGKTIEAGLILWPLLAKQRIRRLLILAPASLVEQWQYRLRTMFDIRVTTYARESDTARADYWNTHSLITASVHTLRDDRNGRHERLLQAEPWDLVIVDEAHHLNHEEQTGATLAFELLQKLEDHNKVRSLLFFTGTPHKGKDFNFLALLRLLRPDLVDDPRLPLTDYVEHLPQMVIRNNKYSVTDLEGRLLFEPPVVTTETYRYSPEEERFYASMTDFVTSGKAYASSLGTSEARTAQLVLITLQKLASSSIAAVRRALQRRLTRLKRTADEAAQAHNLAHELSADATEDDIAHHEELLAELATWLRLVSDEPRWLERLLEEADRVETETKIEAILRTVRERFTGRSVLFFTEYKATQSLLLSRLTMEYGAEQVAFINGDGRAEDVLGDVLVADRTRTAERFNAGEVRLLVSTEAAGEGIDLQGHCHTLIHVDLPWNPMRLQQRVGRINRFGQKHRVEVIAFRNPDTVESRIWEKLNEKIVRIQHALAGSMDEPEDLMQLVLGMAAPEMFTALFANAHSVPKESLSAWFDERTASFGGQDVLSTVNALVGHATKFDFRSVAPQIPRLDLPDLEPFFRLVLAHNKRKVQTTPHGLGFLTPDPWRDSIAVKERYEGLVFDRNAARTIAGDRVIGVGHPVFNRALLQSTALDARHATVPASVLAHPLLVFKARNRVTTDESAVATVVRGVEVQPDGFAPVDDAGLFTRLGELSAKGAGKAHAERLPESAKGHTEAAVAWLYANANTLGLPFELPVFSFEAALWPSDQA